MHARAALTIAVAALSGLAACHADAKNEPADAAAASSSPGPTFGGGGGGLEDASLATRADYIFASSCAGGPEHGCHALSAGGLHLPDDTHDLVDVPSSERPDMMRVVPFDPARSYLWLKVRGDGGIEGGRMPLDGELLPEDLETLRAWIEAGAPE